MMGAVAVGIGISVRVGADVTDGIAERVAATIVAIALELSNGVWVDGLLPHADIMIKVVIMRIKFIKFFIVPFSLIVG